MKCLVTKMCGRDRLMIGGDCVLDRDDQQVRSWTEGKRIAMATDSDCHGIDYFPTRFDMSQTHSNMGSHFSFCSSQESFRSSYS